MFTAVTKLVPDAILQPVATKPLQPSNPRKRGRPSLPTAFYAMVAELYEQAEATGTKAPAQWVGRRMSEVLRREVKASTARRWIMKARAPARGLLPPVPKAIARVTRANAGNSQANGPIAQQQSTRARRKQA